MSNCSNNPKVDANFLKGLTSGPESRRHEQTMFDEIRLSTEYASRPTEHVAHALSYFHGPFGGGSPILSNISNAIQGGNPTLQKLTSSVERASDITISAISDVLNTMELINDITGVNMSTPLLREFVTYSHQIHPSVNEYIQQHIGQYPYYQPISEEIGTMFTIISNAKEIDPMFWLNCGELPTCSLQTASRMLRQIYDKIFEPIAGNIEDSNSFLNTLFLRALPCDSMSHLHPNYSQERPIAHGHNFCMDVHHRKRAENAIPRIFDKLVHIFGDRLRLLNQIFPVKYAIKYEDEIYQVYIENGETPVEPVIVDALNQNITRRSNDLKSLKATKEASGVDSTNVSINVPSPTRVGTPQTTMHPPKVNENLLPPAKEDSNATEHQVSKPN